MRSQKGDADSFIDRADHSSLALTTKLKSKKTKTRPIAMLGMAGMELIQSTAKPMAVFMLGR